MKITINMLSKADSVDGQGVGSAYLEQVSLVRTELSDYFNVYINSHKKTDIVHVHTVNPSFYHKLKSKKNVSVMYCHFLPETLDGSIKLPKFTFNIFKRYVINFYRKADYLVVVNPIFIEPLVKLGVQKERIRYIPNYVSRDKFHILPEETIIEAKKKYEIPLDKFVVLGCGQVQTRKGVLDFVEVAKKNLDKVFVWCGGFSFAGITDGAKEFKHIMEHPPTPNLMFLGIIPRNKMNVMFNIADCLFMPSYNELFPMSILEAVRSDKPVVLRDLELYKDILWDDYLAGKNNDEFSMLINQLATDKEVYASCQEKSRRIAQYYSKENVSKIWLDFYTSIYEEKKKKTK